jgi:hypothetical protein
VLVSDPQQHGESPLDSQDTSKKSPRFGIKNIFSILSDISF